MAIQSQPSRIPEPFAGSGSKNTIPATNATPSASQAASWASGFPPECSQPISAGGCPVPRNDVNGVLNQVSQDYAFRQDGGIWEWSALADYDTQRMVRGSDGLLYWSVAQSGPGVAAGAQDPTLDAAHDYWDQMPSDNASLVHRTGAETIAGAKTFQSSVTVSGSALHVEIDSKNVDKTQTSTSNQYAGAFIIGDLNGYRLMHVRSGMTSSDESYASFYVFDPSDPTPGPNATGNGLMVCYPRSGVPYATAPSTATGRSGDTDILTRDWIPKDTRIVLTAGGNAVSDTDFVHRDVDSSSIYVSGGRAKSEGAYLVAFGPSHSAAPGWFGLHAKNGNNDVALRGTPDGTLTWNGQPVQTSSDERLKTPVSAVPDDVLDAWEAVGWGQFQYLDAVERKGEESARLHLGLIAQRVKTVFEERGLDACEYGILCHEEQEASEEGSAVDIWMVRYTEALAMEAVCQRRRAGRAEARLAALEERLAAIEGKLNTQP